MGTNELYAMASRFHFVSPFTKTEYSMEQVMTKSKRILILSTIAMALAIPVMAQEPDAVGGGVVVSEPGKATVARAVEISAQVLAIDKATRTLTLKGPKGNVVDIVASDEVKNFDQIKVSDLVVARYVQALTLELKKPGSIDGGTVVTEKAGHAKPGERPAVAGARQVTALAEVIGVDPKASTITIKGPRGNVMTLDVLNPDQFKVVKRGDKIEVTYTEALALSVEPTEAVKN